MAKWIILRTLLLTQREFETFDEYIFHCPLVVWMQLKSMFARELGIELADDCVDAKTGRKFNAWIRSKHDNLAAVVEENSEEFKSDSESDAMVWYMFLQLWNDWDGQLVGELGHFLKQGSVVVEDANEN